MGKHLLITFDDAGHPFWPSLQAETGSKHVPTMPNLAALEAQGVLFPRCYGHSRCSSTRALMMTGRHAFRTGVGDNVNLTENGPPNATEPFLPEALSSHSSACIGKYHMNTASNGGLDAARVSCQFDTHIGIVGNIIAGLNTYWYWIKATDGVLSTVGVDIDSRAVNDYQQKVMLDDALTWLDGVSGDWILWVSFQAPHTPRHQPNTAAERAAASPSQPPHMSATMETVTQAFIDEDAPTYEGLGWETDEQATAFHNAMLEAADYELGRLMAHAEVSTGGTINSDVTVWLTTDNGPAGSAVLPPFDSSHGKNSSYELATRLPLLVAGNGVAASQEGLRCRRIVQHVDIFRTICEMESVDLAATFPGVTFDGVDISPYLQDVHSKTFPRSFAYTEQFSPNCDGGIADSDTGATNDSANPTLTTWTRAIHDGIFKLITTMPTGPTGDVTYELYNVRGGDPEETENLIRDNELTLDGVGGVPEVWAGLQRLRAQEAALLP